MGHKCNSCHLNKQHKHSKKPSSSSSSSSKDEHQPEYKYVLKQSLQNHTLLSYDSISSVEGAPMNYDTLRYKLDKHHWEKIWSHVLELVLANAFTCDGKDVQVKIDQVTLTKGSKSSNLKGYYYLESWGVSFHCASANISINPQWQNTLLKDFFVTTITDIQGIPVPTKKQPNPFDWQGTIAISDALPDKKWPLLDDKYSRTKQKAILFALHFLYLLLKTTEYNGNVSLKVEPKKKSKHPKHSRDSDKHKSYSESDKHKSSSESDKHKSYSESDKHKSSSESDKHKSSSESDKHKSSSSGFEYPTTNHSSSHHHHHSHKKKSTCNFCGHH